VSRPPATAATAYGFPAIGISVPLGDYHNQEFEGGSECRGKNGPAPEFVHRRDIEGMLKLCRALLRPRLPGAMRGKNSAAGFREIYGITNDSSETAACPPPSPYLILGGVAKE
jgi:hypothetical protein